MLLSIRHLTHYAYDSPVSLQPHCLRLTPRGDCYGALLERKLTITPCPGYMNASVENDGSISQYAWFKGETIFFSVEARTVIRLLTDTNPFDFLIYPDTCLTLPMRYPPELERDLQAFLAGDKIAPAVRDFAFEVLEGVKGKTLDFLAVLASRMKRDFIYEFRHLGAPFQPQDTLASGRGSCRDWAVLYMASVRAVGLAARFVSGYYFEEQSASADLHAWVEVYLPGGGWRGFDPSLGLACYGHHIALASSAEAAGAAPIQGHFKGKGRAKMKLDLEYRYINEP